MTTFFTADTHFGHAKIIEYCKRPFSTVNEMNIELIQRWNAIVGEYDDIYHLGDFAFANPVPFFNSLKGRKHLVVGNHDPKRVQKLGWASVCASAGQVFDGVYVHLCHYGSSFMGVAQCLQLHGHSHGNLPPLRNRCDVGVDCWDYRPITMHEIQERVKNAGVI